MTIDEYQEQQAILIASLVNIILRILFPFRRPALSELGWLSLLSVIFGPVDKARRRSAELGRQFYDSQRAIHVPDEGRNPVYLEGYNLRQFVENMEPAKQGLRQAGSDDADLTRFANRVAKEVEQGGRRTILSAIERDDRVKGWARVATGRETCAFCLMLVSRGPVYLSARNAGLDADDTTAQQILDSGSNEDLMRLMNRWHPSCDCKVVPVYDRRNWPGRDAYLRAENIWRTATKGYSGRDALNALRRALDRGEIKPADFAVKA